MFLNVCIKTSNSLIINQSIFISTNILEYANFLSINVDDSERKKSILCYIQETAIIKSHVSLKILACHTEYKK